MPRWPPAINGKCDYTRIEPLSNYYYGATYYVGADNKTYIDSEFGCFDSNSQITIHADDNDYIVTSDSLNNNKIDSFVIDGVFNNIKIDATVYSFFDYTGNATHTQTFDIEGCEYDFYLTDEIFEEIKKQMLERFGITVKGSNKFVFKGINVEESGIA